IKVEPGVLIPRQETEELVAWILELYPKETELTVLDVGTGSGCIPIALKNSRPNWSLYGSDVSDTALEIARKNASYNEVDVEFAKDDLFQPSHFSDSKFNLIISNPPYILPSEKSNLDQEVKNYEPEEALFCDSTQKMYGAIEKLSTQLLSKNGALFLELHEDTAQEVQELYLNNNWEVNLKNDYGNKPRFLLAKKLD
ncbi:MAG TPA: peptide chain release factor N(5)-glutamine methyltransferase, partial [Balneolaceae bacterium]|nr:peptide chain release factor N(5)-glutamine methyltransferase [Balneolaceae bacterium]